MINAGEVKTINTTVSRADKNVHTKKKSNTKGLPFIRELIKNRALFLMILPALTVLLINNYLPMFGAIMAFKDLKYTSSSFIMNLLSSEWVGFKNFEFFTTTNYAFIITRNTLLYNLAFIVLTLLTAVPAAIALNELKNRHLAKFYQTVMFLPQFLSWVVIGILAFAFLSTDMGFINKNILAPLGVVPVSWYHEAKYWPFILTFVQIWRSLGYNSVIYLAGISNIDASLYEAAVIDGAGKWKQITHITIPMLKPLMITLTLMQIGRVFFADFGLFYQVTQNSGMLYDTTSVIDTYVFNAMRVMGDMGMSSAVGLYQAVFGFMLVLISNLIVRKIDKDSALF